MASYLDCLLVLRGLGKRIGFDPVSHVYSLGSRGLTPATASYKPFFPKFDSRGISERLARKELGADAGYSLIRARAKELREDWLLKARLGTCVHAYAEACLLSGSHEILDTSFIINSSDWSASFADLFPGYCRSVSSFLSSDLFKGLTFLDAEVLVWDGEFSVAGQIDFITYNSDDGSIDLWDWKTNSSIIPEGVHFGKFGYGELAHLPSTNFYQYSLQLSIYAYLLSRQGLKVRGLHLVHITEDGYKVIDVPYLSDEAGIILRGNIL